jgi:CheY-like chemotaxis protein
MMIAVALLERWGVAVTQAEDGREAVAAVQRAAAAGRPFDAVLMDVQMPVMGGHEAARALRQLEAAGAAQNPRAAAAAAAPGVRPAPLPIIALTAAALFGERDEALAAGMDDFLTKPIDADQLQATLYRWCPRRP